MFEPIHGSAFDITGKGVANPVATFWTRVELVCEKGIVTTDLGGTAKTAEVTSAVCDEIQRLYGKAGKSS